MQFVAEVHDTELSSEASPAGAGSGTVSTAHFPPVQCSASGARASAELVTEPPVPTATQSFTAVQDTPPRALNWSGLATDWSDQAFPFQCAARAFPPLFCPTAVQFPVAGQATPISSPSCLVVRADHFRPFQCSARVIPESRPPTAMQSLAPRQGIAADSAATTGVASGWAVQVCPFQPSPSSRMLLLLYEKPSATQVVDEVQDTPPVKVPPSRVREVGVGVDWTALVVPSQRSARVFPSLPLRVLASPVAVHCDRPVQETPTSSAPLKPNWFAAAAAIRACGVIIALAPAAVARPQWANRRRAGLLSRAAARLAGVLVASADGPPRAVVAVWAAGDAAAAAAGPAPTIAPTRTTAVIPARLITCPAMPSSVGSGPPESLQTHQRRPNRPGGWQRARTRSRTVPAL